MLNVQVDYCNTNVFDVTVLAVAFAVEAAAVLVVGFVAKLFFLLFLHFLTYASMRCAIFFGFISPDLL